MSQHVLQRDGVESGGRIMWWSRVESEATRCNASESRNHAYSKWRKLSLKICDLKFVTAKVQLFVTPYRSRSMATDDMEVDEVDEEYQLVLEKQRKKREAIQREEAAAKAAFVEKKRKKQDEEKKRREEEEKVRLEEERKQREEGERKQREEAEETMHRQDSLKQGTPHGAEVRQPRAESRVQVARKKKTITPVGKIAKEKESDEEEVRTTLRTRDVKKKGKMGRGRKMVKGSSVEATSGDEGVARDEQEQSPKKGRQATTKGTMAAGGGTEASAAQPGKRKTASREPEGVTTGRQCVACFDAGTACKWRTDSTRARSCIACNHAKKKCEVASSSNKKRKVQAVDGSVHTMFPFTENPNDPEPGEYRALIQIYEVLEEMRSDDKKRYDAQQDARKAQDKALLTQIGALAETQLAISANLASMASTFQDYVKGFTVEKKVPTTMHAFISSSMAPQEDVFVTPPKRVRMDREVKAEPAIGNGVGRISKQQCISNPPDDYALISTRTVIRSPTLAFGTSTFHSSRSNDLRGPSNHTFH
jgi:Zn ribbon nucleic-acid-binding protein